MSRKLLMTALTSSVVASTLAAGSTARANTYAGNLYSPAYQHEYRHGVVPTIETWQKMHAWAKFNPDFAATGPNTLSFNGGIDGIGATSSKPKVYLVVFGTQWGTAGTDSNGNLTLSKDTKGEVVRLQQLFKGVGTGSEAWSGTMTQYCDGSLVAIGATSCPSGAPHVGYPTGGDLAGVWYDNSAASPSAASGNQNPVRKMVTSVPGSAAARVPRPT